MLSALPRMACDAVGACQQWHAMLFEKCAEYSHTYVLDECLAKHARDKHGRCKLQQIHDLTQARCLKASVPHLVQRDDVDHSQ